MGDEEKAGREPAGGVRDVTPAAGTPAAPAAGASAGMSAAPAPAPAAPAPADGIPQGFTLALALVDAVPVLLFCVSMLVVASRFGSALFALGALCSALAGAGKVLWKLLLACRRRDVAWLNRQFRALMPAGFALMVAAVAWAAATGALSLGGLAARIASFPACACFAAAALGLAAMGVMAAKLERTDARANWIEQLTNVFAQAMLLIGIVVC